VKVWDRMKEIGGFYIHRGYGVYFTHEERFGYKKSKKAQFISIEDIEKKYGKIVAVLDTCTKKDIEFFNMCQPKIWTEKYVITIEEYDGLEYLVTLPRNPPPEAEIVEKER